MNRALRRTAQASVTLLVLVSLGLATQASAAPVPPATPGELELTAGSDSSITIEWPASPGATSYNIYRGTTSGGEGGVPIASTTDTEYRDAGLSPTPVYFYFARKGAKRFRLLGSRRAAAAGPGKARAVYEFNLAAPRRGDRYVACTKRNYASDMGRAKAKIKACGNRTISSQELALPPPP